MPGHCARSRPALRASDVECDDEADHALVVGRVEAADPGFDQEAPVGRVHRLGVGVLYRVRMRGLDGQADPEVGEGSEALQKGRDEFLGSRVGDAATAAGGHPALAGKERLQLLGPVEHRAVGPAPMLDLDTGQGTPGAIGFGEYDSLLLNGRAGQGVVGHDGPPEG